MKVFISWSGDSSQTLATVLHEWLEQLFPDVDFWISTRDIHAGERWADELDRELEETQFGILCLVPTNLVAPWLLFEAGAISKSVTAARVVPYCLGLQPKEVQGPLSRFNGVSADEAGTRNLVESINSLLENKRSETNLAKTFDKWWPDLKVLLEKIPASTSRGPSLVTVQHVLVGATTTFEQYGAEKDMEILEKNYPGAVTRIHNMKLSDLCDALALNRFDIVHLLGYVDPRTGDFVFSQEERLSANGLLKLLEKASTSLLFLASCDCLTLGAILSRAVNVIAASEDVEAEKMIAWERYFYSLLAKGTSLAVSYDLAQATTDLPMRLLVRNDALFIPSSPAKAG